ncbi:hypothetical protein M413DRAFT_24878 [Hebeloma cylindrosporum]|uniref:DNA 3'-5' helicase n=1 Tax=Hebeloma cylindrosporum TaxID=76867 RepID=A0A0C3CPJ2_HEBCY|nr:hypothetical protein M413DRAFT_24878 [Hebeloma cylindrosporum h7]
MGEPSQTVSTAPAEDTREWLEHLLREKCKISSVREHQLIHGLDLVQGKDLFLVIATGTGKTIVLHAPLLAAQEKKENGVAIIIVPTKLLVEQQAQVAQKHNLKALVIHEDSVRDAKLHGRDLFEELASSSGIVVGVMTPQMLQGFRMKNLLKGREFKDSVRWVLIDEVHLVDEEAGTFLMVYKSIAIFRSLLNSTTTWAAVTATATPERAVEMAKQLGFQPGHHVNARYSIDRPNVKYIPRFFQHPISGHEFLDLSFLIPFGMKSSQDVPLTLIFAKTIASGYAIMQFLDTLLPTSLPNRFNIIKLYNSLMDLDYRKSFIQDFTDGSVLRIGIATDTCTYGFDIPTLQRVVVFDICPSPENLKQKVGRPGRDGNAAEAITFAPPWVCENSNPIGKQALEDQRRRENLPKATLKWYNPSPYHCTRAADLEYYGEEFIDRVCLPGFDCCTTCDPDPQEGRDLAMVERWVQHFKERGNDLDRPKGGIRSDGTFHALEPHMKSSLQDMLIRWRSQKWVARRTSSQRGLPTDFFMPQHILTQVVDRAHICSSLERLRLVCDGWEFLPQYEIELLQFLGKILTGFNLVFKERAEEADTTPDPDLPVQPLTIITPSTSINPVIRLSIQPRQALLKSSHSHNKKRQAPATVDTKLPPQKRIRKGGPVDISEKEN